MSDNEALAGLDTASTTTVTAAAPSSSAAAVIGGDTEVRPPPPPLCGGAGAVVLIGLVSTRFCFGPRSGDPGIEEETMAAVATA